MGRITTYILMALAGTAFWACGDNFETSGNGAFDGFWQLEQVDTLATGGITDMHDELIFWAVQHHVIELRCKKLTADGSSLVRLSVYYHFERSGDTLQFLADPYPVLDLRPNDPYAELRQVQAYGFSRFDEKFIVLRLDDDHMTLQSEVFRMYFRKY